MVKVNQAAILLASPGQPRHQPVHPAIQKNLPIPKCLQQGKRGKSSKTYVNPSSLPGSFSLAPCWRASKASSGSVYNLQVIQKVREDQYPSRASFLSAGVPLHDSVLHNGHVAVCARLKACFGAELGASVRHGCSPLVLLLVNEPWSVSSQIYRLALRCSLHKLSISPLTPPTLHIQPPSLPTQQQLSRFNTHWHCAD